VHHVVSTDDGTAFRRFQNGELDIVRAPSRELPAIRRNMADRLHTATAPGVEFLTVNMQRAPLGTDRRLREALSLAVDRDVLNRRVVAEGQASAYSEVPPGLDDYTPQTLPFRDWPMARRLERAKALMAEAGYGPDHRLPIEISYATNEDRRTMLLAIKAMWEAALPVAVTMSNQEWQVYLAALRQKSFQIGILGYSLPYGDPAVLLRTFVSNAGDFNDSGYANRDFDAAVAEANGATDREHRSAALERAERQLMTDMPVIPIYHLAENFRVNPRVQGWIDSDRYTESRFLSLRE
jgi:oligopeptide transport system substrate-binding protein